MFYLCTLKKYNWNNTWKMKFEFRLLEFIYVLGWAVLSSWLLLNIHPSSAHILAVACIMESLCAPFDWSVMRQMEWGRVDTGPGMELKDIWAGDSGSWYLEHSLKEAHNLLNGFLPLILWTPCSMCQGADSEGQKQSPLLFAKKRNSVSRSESGAHSSFLLSPVKS